MKPRCVFWLVIAFLLSASLVWSAAVSQQTKGHCNPAVAEVKGDVKIEIRCSGVDAAALKLIMKNVDDLRSGLPRIVQLLNEVLRAVSAKALDTKQLEELIASRHKAIFASSEADAKRWAKELLESSSRNESEIKSLSESGKELRDKLLLRWDPLYRFILKEIDSRISALKQTGLITDFEQIDAELVVSDTLSRAMPIRRIVFLGDQEKFSMTLILYQAQIHRGAFVKPGLLQLEEKVNGASYMPIYMVFNRQTTVQFNYNQENQPGKQLNYEGDDPISNEDFRRSISTAIGNSIAFVFRNTAASR